MELISIANQTFSLLTIAGQIIVVGLIVSLITKQSEVLKFFAKYGLALSFAVALITTLGSLFYSEVAGYEPCSLCWLQRIFMYPQVILLGMALLKKDDGIAPYSAALSFLGMLTAGYQSLLQIGIAPSILCSTVGFSVSCSQRFVLQFGYITIPMMALTAFALIFVLMIIKMRRRITFPSAAN